MKVVITSSARPIPLDTARNNLLKGNKSLIQRLNPLYSASIVLVAIGAGASLRGRPMTIGFASGKAAQRSVAQSLARAYGPEKIHVSYIVLDGIVLSEKTKAWKPADKGDDFFIHSDDIADAVWNLCNQPESTWTFELDLRPFGESW